MTYEALWKRLTPLYEAGEAKAIARWMLDVRFGLTMADILCGKVEELSEAAQAELKATLVTGTDTVWVYPESVPLLFNDYLFFFLKIFLSFRNSLYFCIEYETSYH